MRIHTLLIGQPQEMHDERGAWRSSICRTAVDGPVSLGPGGLAGDRVTDTRHHGSPDQAVCCHFLAHYAAWNAEYGLEGTPRALGPGSIGENWTLDWGDETTLCVGDVYEVGTAVVQVAGPRVPCMTQERRLRIEGFYKRSMATLRTGVFLRVLLPGTVQAGDVLRLARRPHPDVAVHRINAVGLDVKDPDEARRLMDIPELDAGWRRRWLQVLESGTE